MVHFVEVSLLYSLIEEFLGWVPARCLRQSHRRARTVEATRRLRQELQRLEGIRGPGTHPLDYTTLTRRLWAQTIGFLRQFRTPTGALARLPSALGGAPVQDIMVRYVGPWHQTRSRAIIPEELQGIFPLAPNTRGALRIHGRHRLPQGQQGALHPHRSVCGRKCSVRARSIASNDLPYSAAQ